MLTDSALPHLPISRLAWSPEHPKHLQLIFSFLLERQPQPTLHQSPSVQHTDFFSTCTETFPLAFLPPAPTSYPAYMQNVCGLSTNHKRMLKADLCMWGIHFHFLTTSLAPCSAGSSDAQEWLLWVSGRGGITARKRAIVVSMQRTLRVSLLWILAIIFNHRFN